MKKISSYIVLFAVIISVFSIGNVKYVNAEDFSLKAPIIVNFVPDDSVSGDIISLSWDVDTSGIVLSYITTFKLLSPKGNILIIEENKSGSDIVSSYQYVPSEEGFNQTETDIDMVFTFQIYYYSAYSSETGPVGEPVLVEYTFSVNWKGTNPRNIVVSFFDDYKLYMLIVAIGVVIGLLIYRKVWLDRNCSPFVDMRDPMSGRIVFDPNTNRPMKVINQKLYEEQKCVSRRKKYERIQKKKMLIDKKENRTIGVVNK